MIGRPDQPESESSKVAAVVPANSQSLTEPFACPSCGQMLAPTCTVCVACKQPIDRAQIKRPVPREARIERLSSEIGYERARFSWSIFGAVLTLWLAAGLLTERFLGAVQSQVIMASALILSSAWVFYDAHQKRVPKPLRWAVGALLLWIVVFPWYLSRRRVVRARCPFMEAEVSPFFRALLFFLLFLFLLSVALILTKTMMPK